MKILEIQISFYKYSKKYYGVASFHSKYVIIGSGYAGMTLFKMLTNVKKIKH
jgi:hypothetical protein